MNDEKTKASNPYQMGDWVSLSPFGNAEQRQSMVRRSAISIVMRLRPEAAVRGDGSHLHGVAIRADGAEQVVRFDGANASEQADLLVEACLREPDPPHKIGLTRESMNALVVLIAAADPNLFTPFVQAELQLLREKALGCYMVEVSFLR